MGWYWDVDRQIAVSEDNTGRHDLLIGPYDSQTDAEVWMPSQSWSADRSDAGDDDDWVDINSAYD